MPSMSRFHVAALVLILAHEEAVEAVGVDPSQSEEVGLVPPGLLKEGLDLTERERGIKRAMSNGLSELKPP